MAVLDHTETGLEKLIVGEMIAAGWLGEQPSDQAPIDHRNYDGHYGVYPADLVEFVKATQPKKWQRLVAIGGGEQGAGEQLVKKVAADLDKRNTIDVLRKGVQTNVGRVDLLARRPEGKADANGEADYASNRLRVVRQVRFDPKSNDSLDVVLFVNGIPTATAELKNRFTHQDVDHAIKQYKENRDTKNLLLGRRAFVHFAVDSELAFMTTKLERKQTRFLPFNQGTGGAGEPGRAGNPSPADGSHPTSYLWREVWQWDAWLELIEDFVFVDEPTADEAKAGKKPVTIFPRFHQWDVVRKCAAEARANGAGRNYLIQHSAGSGKSKEIAWLAHDLSSLHDHDGHKVFDKVVVITSSTVRSRSNRRRSSFAACQRLQSNGSCPIDRRISIRERNTSACALMAPSRTASFRVSTASTARSLRSCAQARSVSRTIASGSTSSTGRRDHHASTTRRACRSLTP